MMGVTKTDQFTAEQNTMATMMKALGHPARIAIIGFLMKVDSCICGDIVNELPLAQPTVSQHLKELKSAGLIKGTVEGTSVCYCIDEDALVVLREYFANVLTNLGNKKNNCC